MNEFHEKIKSALSEQDGNFIHLHHALEKLKPYLPIVPAHLDKKDIVEHIDQMIFRFIKIQDGMGRRLMPLIVEAIEADTSEMTFRAPLKIQTPSRCCVAQKILTLTYQTYATR